MILKSYEIQRNPSNFLKYNVFLLYGENNGLKKEIRESIKTVVSQQDANIELLSLYESDIMDNEENFYNSIYSGSLFSNKKIITINNGTDKIIEQVNNVVDKYPENVFLIIFANVLEKKSKLRNFFETNLKTLCIPCYLDNDKSSILASCWLIAALMDSLISFINPLFSPYNKKKLYFKKFDGFLCIS